MSPERPKLFLYRRRADAPRGTLFYIHGLGESGRCFEQLMADPGLRSWNHLAADLPGYGRSPWADEPLTLAEHAVRLGELLDATCDEPVVVVGHSMGGVIGTLLAEHSPRRVRAFVNVEGNISLDDCNYSSQAARWSEDAWLTDGFDEFLGHLSRDAQKSETPTSEVLRRYHASARLCDPRAFHRNGVDLVAASRKEDLASRMAAIDRPRAYVYGSPRGTGSHSRDLLTAAGIEPVDVRDAGHWPFLDQHEIFVTMIRAFLGRGGRGEESSPWRDPARAWSAC